jgi:hypothetical protein
VIYILKEVHMLHRELLMLDGDLLLKSPPIIVGLLQGIGILYVIITK